MDLLRTFFLDKITASVKWPCRVSVHPRDVKIHTTSLKDRLQLELHLKLQSPCLGASCMRFSGIPRKCVLTEVSCITEERSFKMSNHEVFGVLSVQLVCAVWLSWEYRVVSFTKKRRSPPTRGDSTSGLSPVGTVWRFSVYIDVFSVAQHVFRVCCSKIWRERCAVLR